MQPTLWANCYKIYWSGLLKNVIDGWQFFFNRCLTKISIEGASGVNLVHERHALDELRRGQPHALVVLPQPNAHLHRPHGFRRARHQFPFFAGVGRGQLLLLLPATGRPQGKGIGSHPIAQIGGISKISAVEPYFESVNYILIITLLTCLLKLHTSALILNSSTRTHESESEITIIKCSPISLCLSTSVQDITTFATLRSLPACCWSTRTFPWLFRGRWFRRWLKLVACTSPLRIKNCQVTCSSS